MKKILPLIFILFALDCACKAEGLMTFEEAVRNSKKNLRTSKVIYARRLKSSPATIPDGWAKFFVVTERTKEKPDFLEGIFYESGIFVAKDNALFHEVGIDSADYGMDEQEKFAGDQEKHLYFANKSHGLGNQEDTVNLFYNSALQKQIENIRIQPFVCFIYDFNKDGYDDIIKLDYANITIYNGVPKENEWNVLFYSFWNGIYFNEKWEHAWTSAEQAPEFVIFNGRRGIKLYGKTSLGGEWGWLFFYFDKNKNIFLRDENASSSQLEGVHGSETFFADYGLDFNALDRELNLQQIQNLCPASLRVLRNAIYAKHGRTFKSEDLQALFNEYPWYEASPAYSDSLLTATDKHNIALIKQVEENPKKTGLYLEQTMFDSEIPQAGFSSDRREIYMAKYHLRLHEIATAEVATKGMATYLFMTSEPLFDLSMIDETFHDSEIEFEQRYGQCKPEKSWDSINYFEALYILCGNENVRNPKNNIQTKNPLTGKELLDLQKSIREMKAEEERKKKRFSFPLLKS